MHLTGYAVLFAVLMTTHCLGFIPYQMLGVAKEATLFSIVLIALLYFLNRRNSVMEDRTFSREVLLLMLLPFASVFSCYHYRGQAVVTGMIATRTALFWLLYFLLHKTNFSERKLHKLLMNVGVMATTIYIVQQLVYPTFYWFDVNNLGIVDIRNGLYRFRLFLNNPYIYYGFFASIALAITQKKSTSWQAAVFFALGIVLTLTRQIWFTCFMSVILYPILKTEQGMVKKLIGALFSFLILYVIFLNIGSIVGNEIVSYTISQLKNDDDVRMGAFTFYGLEYWVDWLNVVFGNGVASFGNSAYGNFIQSMEENHAFYRSDVGLVGVLNQYGAIYVFVLFLYYIKVFKNLKYMSTKFRLLFCASFLNLPLASWDIFPVFLSIITYLADCDIKNNKEALECCEEF